MTDIILSHDTALAYWSHPSAQRPPSFDQALAHTEPGDMRGDTHVKTMQRVLSTPLLRGFPRPLDILVSEKNFRYTTRNCRFHYCPALARGPISATSIGLLDVEENPYRILVCTPEMTLVQLAMLVDDIELLEIAFELCGRYSLQPRPDGKLTKRNPVSSPTLIGNFCTSAQGARGSRKLRDVTGWILPNSRSPKESQLAIASLLPRSRGGYGLPRPLLNQELDVPPRIIPVLDAPTIVPDLYWPDSGVVLEYDSDLEHTPQNANHDARKRSAYRMMDLELVSLTPDQLFDKAAFENIMTSLEKRLKRGFKPLNAELLEKRTDLYNRLFRKQRRGRSFIHTTDGKR